MQLGNSCDSLPIFCPEVRPLAQKTAGLWQPKRSRIVSPWSPSTHGSATPQHMSKTAICQICHQSRLTSDGETAELIRPSLLEFMKKQHPQWDGTGFVCFDHIAHDRGEYVNCLLYTSDAADERSSVDLG